MTYTNTVNCDGGRVIRTCTHVSKRTFCTRRFPFTAQLDARPTYIWSNSRDDGTLRRRRKKKGIHDADVRRETRRRETSAVCSEQKNIPQ